MGDKSINDLEAIFKKFENESFLLPSSDVLKPSIPDCLNKMGVNWTRAQLYRTVVSDLSDLRDVYYDVLVFFSPSGIESLFKNFPDFEQKTLESLFLEMQQNLQMMRQNLELILSSYPRNALNEHGH